MIRRMGRGFKEYKGKARKRDMRHRKEHVCMQPRSGWTQGRQRAKRRGGCVYV
jgi:hypothetical protein